MTNEELQRENTILRGLLPKLGVPCVYCGLSNMGQCASGFPGCAQADDLLCADDEVSRRLLAKNRKMEAALKDVAAHFTETPTGDHVCWIGETTAILVKEALKP